jgi:hypothetical protein
MLRFSERSVEMNFCAEFRWRDRPVTWWALTQAEETLEGFDAVARNATAAFVFQFKASSGIVRGNRRFHAGHDQMRLLAALASRAGRGVYYVLPDLSTWADFVAAGSRIRPACWYLDVINIPWPRGVPMTLTHPPRPRASGAHYIEMSPPTAVIRSEPVEVPLIAPQEFDRQVTEPISDIEALRGWVADFRPSLRRHGGHGSATALAFVP